MNGPVGGKSGTSEIGLPLHVVQVGWDASVLDPTAASDARQRQLTYARLLDGKRPGSQMTVVVLGAPAGGRELSDGNLTVVPAAGRWASVGGLPRMLQRLAAIRPISVVAAQSPFEEGWSALAYCRNRIPVVAQVHFDLLADAALPGGALPRRLAGRARRSLALRLLPRYRSVRAVVPEMAERLLALGARKVMVVPVPIPDLDAFRAIAAGERVRAGPRILYVGRLAPEKNLPLWLEVARRIAVDLPSARFEIVGDGAEREALEQLAGRLGIGDRVEFRGPVGRPDLPSRFGSASALLLTSDHEGFGRVLVEAMAAGLPVVSTATSGAREVAGDCGLLAPVGDAAGLARATVRLLTDAELRRRVVAAGLARVDGQYDPLRLAEAWVDMLIDAAEQPLPAPQRP